MGGKKPSLPSRSSLARNTVALIVGLSGLVTIFEILLAVLHLRHSQIVLADERVTLLVGLSLIYLANLLRRGKRIAWAIALVLYTYLFVRNLRHFDFDLSRTEYTLRYALLNTVLPALMLGALIINRQLFNVKSQLRNFWTGLVQAAVILLVAFLYGVVGFQVIDQRDFHRKIPILTGAHYTADQFNLTTNKPLEPQTKRAQLFIDSLSVISFGAVFYVGVSLFAPIRFKLSHSTRDRRDMERLLKLHPSTSENFFKLWPRDKDYFFTPSRDAGLAYKVAAGTALVVGDPAGKSSEFKNLLNSFIEYCWVNDWEPVLMHTEDKNKNLYKNLGLEMQKIGEEAIVDTAHFVKSVMPNKYFRHIANRFERQKFTTEILLPPHSQELLHRLHQVSNDWLGAPGRVERGFMMGYFTDEYIQQCSLMVARNKAGVIHAFLNQLPIINSQEVSFDFLRNTGGGPGNINDYLMMNFISYLHSKKVPRLNIGLSPLAGLKTRPDKDRSIVDSILHLTYNKAGRLYSFQGLNRFKSKYEPIWEDRYVVYKGGVAIVSKTATAMARAMALPKHQKH